MPETGLSLLAPLASLLRLVLTIYMYLVIARALISWVNPNPYNKAVRFLAKVTDPALDLIRRVLPVRFGGIDLAPVVLILLIVFVDGFLITSLKFLAYGASFSVIPRTFLLSVITLVKGVVWAFLVILIIRAVLSWISPDPYNILVQFIYAVTEPILYPLRRSLPLNWGGMDMTPALLCVVLYLIAALLDQAALMAAGPLLYH
jgi:YggT family protein